MGQNKRYGSDLSRASVADFVLRPRPLSLAPEQIGGPIRTAKRPIPVVAWVPFLVERVVYIELDGHALEWTGKAVKVEAEMRAGAKHTVWVWASAVRRGR